MPSGLALFAILRYGPLSLISIFTGAICVNWYASGVPEIVIPTAFGSALEALVGYYIIKALLPKFKNDYFFSSFMIYVIASIPAVFCSALFGVGALYFNKSLNLIQIMEIAITWYFGDIFGIIFITPFLNIIVKNGFHFSNNNTFLKSITPANILLIAVSILSIYLCGVLKQISLLIFCLTCIILYSVIFCSEICTVILNIIITFTIIGFTINGLGPLKFENPNTNLLLIQSLLFSVVYITFAFATVNQKKELKPIKSQIILISAFFSFCLFVFQYYIEIYDREWFLDQVKEAEIAIQNQNISYESIFRGAVGFFHSHSKVDFQAWKSYVSALDLDSDLKAVNGLGFVEKDLDKNVVKFIEPYEPNKQSIGFDLGAVIQSRFGTDLARDTNSLTRSKQIEFESDSGLQSGFLLFYPVYNSKSYPKTIDERREKIIGWIFAPVVSEQYFKIALKLFTHSLRVQLRFENERFANNIAFTNFKNINEKSIFNVTKKIMIGQVPLVAEWDIGPNFILYSDQYTVFFMIFLIIFGIMILFLFVKERTVASRATDIAREMHAEYEKQKLKLYHASKLSSLGEMAAGIAHEINNPLAIIEGGVSLLAARLKENEKEKSILSKISNSVDRIVRIINGLRKFSRTTDSFDISNCSLKSIISESIILIEHNIKKHEITITIEPEMDFIVSGNEIDLEQVFVNLLNNSIHAIKKLPERWIKINLHSKEDSKVLIEFIDSGSGISQPIREKIFDPFFTTKEIGEGTGLGMSISKGILEDYGGSIEINENHPNTCFIISLNLADSSSYN